MKFKGKYLFWGLIILFSPEIWAGPPFITDDPNPVDYKHANFYFFSTLDRVPNNQLLALPALQIDYGLLPNLEITGTLSYVFNTPRGGEASPSANGLGDSQIGFKYAFILENKSHPQVAFAPLYFIPTGNANRGLGNGRSQLLLPLWIQKSWNDWTSYGGGGYLLNSAPNMKNAFLGGCVLQKQINENLFLGGEIFSQSPNSNTTQSYVLAVLGGGYSFTPKISTLFSVGHSIIGMDYLVGYLGLTLTL